MPGELQGSVDASHWVGETGAKETFCVMDFGDAREEVIAQPEVKSQFRIHLPVVLEVRRDGTEARTELLLQILLETSLIDFANQEARVGRAGAGGSHIGRLAVTRRVDGCGFGDSVRQSELTAEARNTG